MRYPILNQQNAKRIIDARIADQDIDCGDLIQYRGEGEDFSRDMVSNLYKALMELKARYPQSLRRRDPAGGRFESEACILIHKGLSANEDVYSDLDFWTYLSVCEFPEIIEWRHSVEGGTIKIANYGVGNRPENLIYRMWLRTELVALPQPEERYSLAARGDIDLWRSHLLRQSYSNCRKLARALVRFQYPDSAPTKATLTSERIRELAKRLKRIYANMVFAFLDEKAISSLIEREAVALG
jgi:hypothetical protein